LYAGGAVGYYAGNVTIDKCELDPYRASGYGIMINTTNNGGGVGKHFENYTVRDTHFESYVNTPHSVGVVLGAGGLMDVRALHIVRCRTEGMLHGFNVEAALGAGETQRLEITGTSGFAPITLSTLCTRSNIHNNNGITVVDQNVSATDPNYIYDCLQANITQTAFTRAYNCPDSVGVDWEDVNADPWPNPTGGQWEPREVKMHNAHATFAANPYRIYTYINGAWRYNVLT